MQPSVVQCWPAALRGLEEPVHSFLAELGASYRERTFIAVPALGHPLHLPFPSADILHIWRAIPVPHSSLASESIPMMLRQHIQNIEKGQTMPTMTVGRSTWYHPEFLHMARPKRGRARPTISLELDCDLERFFLVECCAHHHDSGSHCTRELDVMGRQKNG